MAHSEGQGLGAARRAQLVEDRRYVKLDRVLGKPEARGDLLLDLNRLQASHAKTKCGQSPGKPSSSAS